MGTIPFTGLTFNEALPPILLSVFLLTLAQNVFKKCCTCPRFDGEAHKTDDIVEAAVRIVTQERRKYAIRNRLASSANRR